MDLPVNPPLKPMLAKSTTKLPTDGSCIFEPKWDGFRCIIFRDGDEVVLGSRNEKPLTRYFPELIQPIRDALPERCAVDGELVMVTEAGLNFDMLGQRIHPAQSRIDMLAETTPATFVAFDLIAVDDANLTERPFVDRQELLAARIQTAGRSIRLTPSTRDVGVAQDWFERFEGVGFDGVIAKPADGTYQPNKRTLLKIKHQREVDVVVAGYRVHKDGLGVGSLLLGVSDSSGTLQHIGVASSFSTEDRRALVDELAPYEVSESELANHPWAAWGNAEAHNETTRMPGTPHRWSQQRDHSWVPLRPERVAEVGYQQLTAGRLRHPAKFLRWRPDRSPDSCTFDQFEVMAPPEFETIFGN